MRYEEILKEIEKELENKFKKVFLKGTTAIVLGTKKSSYFYKPEVIRKLEEKINKSYETFEKRWEEKEKEYVQKEEKIKEELKQRLEIVKEVEQEKTETEFYHDIPKSVVERRDIDGTPYGYEQIDFNSYPLKTKTRTVKARYLIIKDKQTGEEFKVLKHQFNEWLEKYAEKLAGYKKFKEEYWEEWNRFRKEVKEIEYLIGNFRVRYGFDEDYGIYVYEFPTEKEFENTIKVFQKEGNVFMDLEDIIRNQEMLDKYGLVLLKIEPNRKDPRKLFTKRLDKHDNEKIYIVDKRDIHNSKTLIGDIRIAVVKPVKFIKTIKLKNGGTRELWKSIPLSFNEIMEHIANS